jgi:hypothetical protein
MRVATSLLIIGSRYLSELGAFGVPTENIHKKQWPPKMLWPEV